MIQSRMFTAVRKSLDICWSVVAVTSPALWVHIMLDRMLAKVVQRRAMLPK